MRGIINIISIAIVAIVTLVILISVLILGKIRYAEAGEKVREEITEGALERIPSLKVIGTPEARLLGCEKEGPLYKYNFNILGLTVLHESIEKIGEEITFMPIFRYKGVESKPLDNTVVTLKLREQKTIWPEGLMYQFTSVRAPTIFVDTLENVWPTFGKNFPLEVEQPVIFKNFRIEVVAVRPESIIFGPCKVSVLVRCRDDKLVPSLKECPNPNDEFGPCIERMNLCNTPISVRLKGFDNTRLECEFRKPKIEIIVPTQLDQPLPEPINYPDTADMIFCKPTDDLPCPPDKYITYEPLNITPEFYNAGNCLPR